MSTKNIVPFIDENPDNELKDHTWVRRSFLLSQEKIDEGERFWSTYCASMGKVTDSSLGGSIVINPLPQFSHHCDPPLGSMNESHNPDYADKQNHSFSPDLVTGSGHYYDEAFVENMHVIHMQFGHIRFRGLFSFFFGMYDARAGVLARQGRTGFTYWAGKTLLTLVTLPFQAVLLGGRVLNFMLNRPSTHFAYLYPAMGTYWARATLIMNNFTSAMNISPQTFDQVAHTEVTLENGEVVELSDIKEGDGQDIMEYAFRQTGGIFRKNGGIDLYLVANKAQRMLNVQAEMFEKAALDATDVVSYQKNLVNIMKNTKISENAGEPTELRSYLKRFHESAFGNLIFADMTADVKAQSDADVQGLIDAANGTQTAVPVPAAAGTTPATPVAADGTPAAAGTTPVVAGAVPATTPPATTTAAPAAAAVTGAAPTATPAVAPATDPATTPAATGGVPEVGQLPEFNAEDISATDTQATSFMSKWTRSILGKWNFIKGWASEGTEYLSADLKGGSQFISFRVDAPGTSSYSFSNSLTTSEIEQKINGISSGMNAKIYSFAGGNTGIGAVDAAMGLVGGFVRGALDAIHLGGIYALMGGAQVDIPSHWESSAATLPTTSYSFDLISPGGDDLSRALSIYAPLSCILSACIPQSTGGASYTHPFYCMLYDRGRAMVRLGMVSDLTMEWGVGNLPFNKENKALRARITMGIKDATNVFHIPVDAGFNITNPWETILNQDSKFNDFVATLSAVGMGNFIYPSRKFAVAMARQKLNYDSYFSRSHWSNQVGNSDLSQTLASLFGFNKMNVRA